jgi:hypothetical protein
MPRKSKTEVLPPARPIPDVRAMLDRLVEEKVGELMSKGSESLFQPYFQSKRVVDEIRKQQTVSEQEKWSRYLKKWGCDVCETKRCPHCALGRCRACYQRTFQRLKEFMDQAASEQAGNSVFLDRQGDLAREALKPLSPPLPPEKRMDLEGIAREALRPAQKALPAGKKRG